MASYLRSPLLSESRCRQLVRSATSAPAVGPNLYLIHLVMDGENQYV
ncbi:hypothetical protein PVAP13_6NG197600 [Panicum virgatum]|uniref:Uncharacterized protein n=1 Tax=Panicum virgatum TaxID=38727 RepID=A0A8T0QWF0_PANVG|nr:hypothetical protein PVAP13_6NG197600 [Panicum virgatum]